MAESDDKSGDTQEQDEALVGPRLRDARKSQSLTISELAKKLHVDEQTLRAIEANDFQALGAPVFARGHIRKYADILRIDYATVLEDFDAMQAAEDPPPVVASRPAGAAARGLPAWVFALLGAVLTLALILWWFLSAEPATPQPAVAAPEPSASATSEEAGTVEPGRFELPAVVGSTSDPEPAIASDFPAEPVSQTPASNPVSLPGSELTLQFSATCWTEVRDASGSRLYSGTALAGESQSLRGEPPFSIVLGNRRAVEMRLDGALVSIPASAIRGRTARFNVPAP